MLNETNIKFEIITIKYKDNMERKNRKHISVNSIRNGPTVKIN